MLCDHTVKISVAGVYSQALASKYWIAIFL